MRKIFVEAGSTRGKSSLWASGVCGGAESSVDFPGDPGGPNVPLLVTVLFFVFWFLKVSNFLNFFVKFVFHQKFELFVGVRLFPTKTPQTYFLTFSNFHRLKLLKMKKSKFLIKNILICGFQKFGNFRLYSKICEIWRWTQEMNCEV